MAGFDGEDTAGCGKEGWVIGEEGGAAKVGTDAGGGVGVGERDEGGRGAVGEFVGAGGDGGVAGCGEDGADGVGVGCFVLGVRC